MERANLQQLCKLSSHVSIEILVTKDAMMDESLKGGHARNMSQRV